MNDAEVKKNSNIAAIFEVTLLLAGMFVIVVIGLFTALAPIALINHYQKDPAVMTAISCMSAAMCLIIAVHKTRKEFTKFIIPMLFCIFAGAIITFVIIKLYLVGIFG